MIMEHKEYLKKTAWLLVISACIAFFISIALIGLNVYYANLTANDLRFEWIWSALQTVINVYIPLVVLFAVTIFIRDYVLQTYKGRKLLLKTVLYILIGIIVVPLVNFITHMGLGYHLDDSGVLHDIMGFTAVSLFGLLYELNIKKLKK